MWPADWPRSASSGRNSGRCKQWQTALKIGLKEFGESDNPPPPSTFKSRGELEICPGAKL